MHSIDQKKDLNFFFFFFFFFVIKSRGKNTESELGPRYSQSRGKNTARECLRMYLR